MLVGKAGLAQELKSIVALIKETAGLLDRTVARMEFQTRKAVINSMNL